MPQFLGSTSACFFLAFPETVIIQQKILKLNAHWTVEIQQNETAFAPAHCSMAITTQWVFPDIIIVYDK